MEKNGQSRKCQWVLLSSVEGVEEFPEADFYIPDYYQPTWLFQRQIVWKKTYCFLLSLRARWYKQSKGRGFSVFPSDLCGSKTSFVSWFILSRLLCCFRVCLALGDSPSGHKITLKITDPSVTWRGLFSPNDTTIRPAREGLPPERGPNSTDNVSRVAGTLCFLVLRTNRQGGRQAYFDHLEVCIHFWPPHVAHSDSDDIQDAKRSNGYREGIPQT